MRKGRALAGLAGRGRMQVPNSCAAVVEARFFTGEIAKAVYSSVSAVSIAVVFYTPSIVQALDTGIANALGVH